MTLNEAIEAAAATVRSLRESAAEDDRYRVLAEDAERDLGWLRELRARRQAMRQAMGREDDERNAAGDLCCCNVNLQGAPAPQFRDGCPMHPRGDLTHISEALQPLRERLARQTAEAQAEVVAELAAERDCDRCTSPPDQRRWLLGTESLCYGCAVRAVAPVGDLELTLAMTVQEQLEVAEIEHCGGEKFAGLCSLDWSAWERLMLLAELVLAPEPEVKP